MAAYILMTQSEYAKKCGKSRAIINYYVKKGYLDTAMISGVPHIRIPGDMVDDLDNESIGQSERLQIAWIK